jgi:peptidoglycan/LPS O-acetylase OafA/YrhL
MDAPRESANLDFLRSVAVLFVTGFHLLFLFEQRHSPFVKHLSFFHSIGNWGVLIFFVHTSFVLMFSLERQHFRLGGRSAYLPFLAKRIFRIFPLSAFIVLLVTAFGLPVAYLRGGVFAPAHLNWAGILSNLLLIQNVSHTDSVLGTLWSLPYEMEMYLFLLSLFILVWRVRRAWPILLLWTMTVVVDMHGRSLERLGVPDFVLYLPYFLSGVFAYELTRAWKLRLPAFLWPLVLGMLTLAYLTNPAKLNSWLCCMMLGVLIPQFRDFRNPMANRILQIIARYSYGIYLTHFICIWFAFQAIGNVPEWSRWVVFFATGTASPVALYHLLEQPMIRVGETIAANLPARLAYRVRVPA